MQALKDRLTSKLGEKSKSKDKEGSSTLKTSTSADGKHSTLHDSHHQTAGASSTTASSATASATNASNAQSAEKGIAFRIEPDEISSFSCSFALLIKRNDGHTRCQCIERDIFYVCA